MEHVTPARFPLGLNPGNAMSSALNIFTNTFFCVGDWFAQYMSTNWSSEQPLQCGLERLLVSLGLRVQSLPPLNLFLKSP